MKIIIPILVALGATFARESNAQTVYQTPHDVFVEAIDHGQAEGELQGEVAAQFTRQFHSDGSLLVRATVVKRYQQAGCARLDTVLTKKDVDMPNQGQDRRCFENTTQLLQGRDAACQAGLRSCHEFIFSSKCVILA